MLQAWQAEELLHWVARDASPDSVSSGATQATDLARQNPLPVAAVGAFVGGFLLGRLTKRT